MVSCKIGTGSVFQSDKIYTPKTKKVKAIQFIPTSESKDPSFKDVILRIFVITTYTQHPLEKLRGWQDPCIVSGDGTDWWWRRWGALTLYKQHPTQN